MGTCGKLEHCKCPTSVRYMDPKGYPVQYFPLSNGNWQRTSWAPPLTCGWQVHPAPQARGGNRVRQSNVTGTARWRKWKSNLCTNPNCKNPSAIHPFNKAEYDEERCGLCIQQEKLRRQ